MNIRRKKWLRRLGFPSGGGKMGNGETLPDLENSTALAELYNVSLDELVKHNTDKAGYAIPPKGKHIFGTVTIGDRGQIVIPKRQGIFSVLNLVMTLLSLAMKQSTV